MEENAGFRSGFVAIIGRPNVGKSTLLNRILGEKIVIVSDKPQTTRNRIRGIYTVPGAQAVFIDTPGIHKAKSKLNRFMVEEALASVKEVDLILFLVEAGVAISETEKEIAATLSEAGAPIYLVQNKADLCDVEKAFAQAEELRGIVPCTSIFRVSAITGAGVDALAAQVVASLPEGPMYFPDDILTDVPERFVAAEIVREKVFRMTRDEIPYSIAVEVESFKERPDGTVAIAAVIDVERDSQKGIVIGRKGEMLKKIGTQARHELEDLLQTKVFLELFVRVRKNWTQDDRMLRELGYK